MAAPNLRAFFAQNAEKIPTRKLVVSDRFKDDEGNPIEWEIRALTAGEQQQIRSQTLNMDASAESSLKIRYDSAKGNTLTAAKAVVFPDLENAELQDSYGVKRAQDLIGVMLLPGELETLLAAVNEMNGVKSPAKLEADAKN